MNDDLIDFMGVKGRKPNIVGNRWVGNQRISGFRTTPGAPNVEAYHGITPAEGTTSLLNGSWDRFFEPSHAEFERRAHPFTESGAPTPDNPGLPPPPALGRGLTVPNDQPAAPAAKLITDHLSDGLTLPGDAVLPPGITRQQFQADTAPPSFPAPQQFRAAAGTRAAEIADFYRTLGTAIGTVSFQPQGTANRSSQYPYHG